MEFKKDEYRKSRGNYSRKLILCCRVCKNKVAEYQKDGPGNLRRMYLDRIISPKELASFYFVPINKIPVFKCKKCKEDLGTPYIYKKEKRKAFKLYQDVLVKKIVSLNKN